MITRWKDVVFILLFQKRSRQNAYRTSGWYSLLVTCLLLVAQTAFAIHTSRIAVLYPESGSRVNKLYMSIILGMKEKGINIQSRKLTSDTSAEDIQKWLHDQGSKAVILLGKQGQKFSKQLDVTIPVVTGAHVGVQADRSAVTLAADPQQLLHLLKQLQPGIRRVYVIYNEANSGWLIKQARRAAKHAGINLNAIEVDSVLASGQALKQVIKKAKTQRDAIWLSLDPILPMKPLLPELLKTAWENNLIIFSGNPYHVQQGTLFALYPNYTELGRQLVELALSKIKQNGHTRHEPSRYLNSAINTRTASHLGIQVESPKIASFNLVFPAR